MRPEDWEKDHPYSAGDDSFEADADAYEEGLVRDYACEECSTPGFIHLVIPRKRVVFTEDE